MTFITCSFVSQFHPRNQKPHDGENSDLKLSLKLKEIVKNPGGVG